MHPLSQSLQSHLTPLSKQSFLNLHFTDPQGKQELIHDYLLACLLPKEWQASDDSLAIQIPEGQELSVVYIDIMGQFKARQFNEKVKQAYNRYELWKCLGSDFTEKDKTTDKHRFIKQVMSSLYVYRCMDGNEFNLVVRALGSFLKRNRGIGLVIIDGMQFVEATESGYDRNKH